mmetsp:Transcript_33350/g.64466  ORF Transcript_33350/g.64466 Transcript_33350/m.64466 type:complete len:759 (-) Transcript_33350:292-2568(-)
MPGRRKKALAKKRAQKQAEAEAKKKAEAAAADVTKEAGNTLAAGDDLDDWTAAWEECKKGNGIWGGRGRGGRGTKLYSIYGKVENVHVEGVTLQYDGQVLLQRSTLRLSRGHRYALIGPNGCGKTTLLKRMARQAVPGLPLSVKVALVDQELIIPGNLETSAHEILTHACMSTIEAEEKEIKALVREQTALEDRMAAQEEGNDADDADADEDDAEGEGEDQQEAFVERLCEIAERFEELGVDDTGKLTPEGKKRRDKTIAEAGERAGTILRKMGFDAEQVKLLPSKLSGGFRMRLSLACAIVSQPDVLILDEPTNHLDIQGVLWLQKFLGLCCKKPEEAKAKKDKSGKKKKSFLRKTAESIGSILFVSHDRVFLKAVATDIIEFKNKQLIYHPCGYEDYLEMTAQKGLHRSRMFEAQQRRDAEVKAMVHRQEAAAAHAAKGKKGHGVDPNKQRQAKTMMKKAERAGMFRMDGKKFKLRSLSKLSEDAMRLPEKVRAEELKRERELKFKFPNVEPEELRLASQDAPFLDFEGASVGYPLDNGKTHVVLRNISVSVGMKSRVAVVGPNGAGKSTLLGLITGSLPSLGDDAKVSRNRNLRIAVVNQHHIEALESHLDKSAVELLQHQETNVSALAARSHLGAFGLVGPLALKKIRTLSGGQKARLALSLVTWQRPHLIVLDEPTNHLDMQSLDALADALDHYRGGIILVSHNQDFLCTVCNELWWVQGGAVGVRKVSGENEKEVRSKFGDVFAKYTSAATR